MNPVWVTEGDSPVILASPHAGLFIPDAIKARLNETGKSLIDADWHVTQLYAGLLPEATYVTANFHRYVIDANRDPGGQSLYPGQNTTPLCTLTTFDDVPIYYDGQEPDAAEIEQRRLDFHAPYHQALRDQIARVHARYGLAVIYDCHSIRQTVPFLFAGALPDFNIGTFNGKSCDLAFEQTVAQICQSTADYSTVLNGRFVGGWTTRHYGRPDTGVHAVQMELSQSTYMDTDDPWEFQPNKAGAVQPVLKDILAAIDALARLKSKRL